MTDAERPERLQIMLSGDELTALDDWRFAQRMPSRASAVRELLKRGLAAEGYAIDQGSVNPDLWCLAAPIVTVAGEAREVLTIITNRSRFARDEATLIAAIVAVAHAASRVADTGGATAVGVEPLVTQYMVDAARHALDVP